MSGRAISVAIAIAIALGAATGVTVPIASAATTVGQLPPALDDPTNCNPATTLVQASLAAGTSYNIPAAGVITAWQTRAGSGSAGTTARFVVYRNTPDLNQFQLLGRSEIEPITANALNGFAARIPVTPPGVVSIRTGPGGGPCLFETGLFADQVRVSEGQPDPEPGQSTTFAGGVDMEQRTNVLATLEPDVDEDGWGDESQDLCPGDGGQSQGCDPASVTITDTPKKKLKTKRSRVRVRFEFRAEPSGASVVCSLATRRFDDCDSPLSLKVRATRAGKRHQLSIVATSPTGATAGDEYRFRAKRKG